MRMLAAEVAGEPGPRIGDIRVRLSLSSDPHALRLLHATVEMGLMKPSQI